MLQVILLLQSAGNSQPTTPTTTNKIGCKKKKDRRAYASHLSRRSPASACPSRSLRAPASPSQQRTAVINRALCCLHFFCLCHLHCTALSASACLAQFIYYCCLNPFTTTLQSTSTAGHGLALDRIARHRSLSNDSSANRSLSSACCCCSPHFHTQEPAGLPSHRQSLQSCLEAWATIMNSQASLL